MQKLSWDTLFSPVSWLRECSVLYQDNQLCNPWRHNVGFPPTVICMQNSKRQVPAGTIQVLARMVPAEAVNWLQLAFKCCFHPYRHLAVAVTNVIPIIFRARQPHLPTCCAALTARHQHQVSLLHGSLKLRQLLSLQSYSWAVAVLERCPWLSLLGHYKNTVPINAGVSSGDKVECHNVP